MLQSANPAILIENIGLIVPILDILADQPTYANCTTLAAQLRAFAAFLNTPTGQPLPGGALTLLKAQGVAFVPPATSTGTLAKYRVPDVPGAPIDAESRVGLGVVASAGYARLSDTLHPALNEMSPLTLVGDVSSLATDLLLIVDKLSKETATIPGIVDKAAAMTALSVVASQLGSVNNYQQSLADVGALQSALGNFGGQTGFGNLGNILGMAQGVMGMLGGLANGRILGGLGGMLGNLGGLVGAIPGLQGLTGALGSLTGGLGQITGLLGGLGGLGNLGGLLGNLGNLGGLGSMLGNIGGMMGGLGNIMGGIRGMIGGEKGMLGMAGNALQIIAGSFNLRALANSACGAGVLGNVGSGALQSALGMGGASGGGSSGGTGGGQIGDTGLVSGPANPVPSLPTFAGGLNDKQGSGAAPNVVPTLPSSPGLGAFGNPGSFVPAPTPITNPPTPPQRPAKLND